MVSLADESNRSGGFFFDSDLRSDTDDLLADPAMRQSYKRSPVRFHLLRTGYSTPFMILIVVCQVVAAFVLPYFLRGHDNQTENKTTSYSLLLYMHALVWLLFLINDRFARHEHTISRRQGYLEFYRITRYLRRMPLMIMSGGNTFLLILSTLLDDYCNQDCGSHNHHYHNPGRSSILDFDILNNILQYSSSTPNAASTNTTSIPNNTTTETTTASPVIPGPPSECCPAVHLNRSNYLQIVFCIEGAIMLSILLIYLVKTIKFNKNEVQPDVLEQDHSTTSTLQAQNSPVEIGFRDDTCVDDLMEKQAEMIRYLKEHNAALGKRVMELTSQLQNIKT